MRGEWAWYPAAGLLILSLAGGALAGGSGATGAAEGGPAEVVTRAGSEPLRTARARDAWRFVFEPSGEVWAWTHSGHDSLVWWDYGASVLMEIAQGRGHRLWFGAAYRNAAGYKASQTLTPFDPRHIDSYQDFGWRWEFRPRRLVFVYLHRGCLHEIDVKIRSAPFWTLATVGFGTISPMEVGEAAPRVRRTGRPRVEGYLYAGPMVHGGPQTVLGNTPTLQGEASVKLAGLLPVTRTFLLELSFRWDRQLLRESFADRWRDRGEVRLLFLAVREGGSAAFFIGRTLHDDFLYRRAPVSWSWGLLHRF